MAVKPTILVLLIILVLVALRRRQPVDPFWGDRRRHGRYITNAADLKLHGISDEEWAAFYRVIEESDDGIQAADPYPASRLS